MPKVLTNLTLLCSDMIKKEWTISVFTFSYKTNGYIVLVKLDENSDFFNYLPVQVVFIDRKNTGRMLTVSANLYGFSIDAKEFRRYFGIEYGSNLGDIFQQFYRYFNTYIPDKVPEKYPNELVDEMEKSLNRSDKTNPNANNCYDARHNGLDPRTGKQKYRSPYNSDKTKLRRPTLYGLLGDDKTISFYYNDEDRYYSDEEIMARFAQHNR